MALITENGWPQIDSTQLQRGLVPGLNGVQIELRAGDVSDVLRAWMIWYDRNVEDIEANYLPRDEWGWSATNSVWNSNHLSGTAVDINATKYPMGSHNMPAAKADKVREGQRLFDGKVFWGSVWDNPDEMHFQIQGNATDIAPLAKRLREGYLGLLAPEVAPDPLRFPLPLGWFYGPLDGPNESVSGQWDGEPPSYREGLKRWQTAVGVPPTGIWDAATCAAAQQTQRDHGWQLDTLNGYVYEGEWNVVIREGYRPSVRADQHVTWADVSQYQDAPIDGTYPYRVFCFRINTSKTMDKLAVQNYQAAKQLANDGRLDLIIGYSFYRPGHDTLGVAKKFVADNGGIHPKFAWMIDVENGSGSAGGAVSGDNTADVNRLVDEAIAWLGDPKRVCGYQNFVSDPGLWRSRRPDLKMIIPNYGLAPGEGRRPKGDNFFAHQYTDSEACRPWAKGVDMNWYPGPLDELLAAFGVKERPVPPIVIVVPPDPPPTTPVPDLSDHDMLVQIHGKVMTNWASRAGDGFKDDLVGFVHEIHKNTKPKG